MQRRAVPAELSFVGEDQVLIRMSTGARARDGHILEPQGCVLDNYRDNPIQLWLHDPAEPVGTNSNIVIGTEYIEARTTFAPLGISPTADRIRGLVKAGVVRSVSIGFEILEAEPIDPARPRAGLRVARWELLECSFVSVGSDVGAVVTARAAPENEEVKTMPDRMTEARTRMLIASPTPKKRDLYDCASLAYLLEQAGYIQKFASWEADIEGDNSPVPTMLGEACKQLGEALVAMTTEEVAEMMASIGMADDSAAEVGERASPRLRAWQMAYVAVEQRAGKVLSAKNRAALSDAHDQIESGRSAIRAILDASEDDEDTTDVQTSEGTGDSDGSADGRALDLDVRKRQMTLLELSSL